MTAPRISRTPANIAARVSQVATIAPSIDERLAQHAAILSAHPIADHPVSTAPSPLTVRAALSTEAIPRGTKEPYLIDAPLSLVDPGPYNARAIYRTKRIAELVKSIGEKGQDTPGSATIRNGRFVLAAGHYRRLAMRSLQAETMKLMIHEDITDQQLYELSYRENDQREGQSALDNAIAWSKLLKDGVYASETELAAKLEISLPNLNKTLAIMKLSDPIRELVAEDPTAFGLSTLYELSLFEPIGGFDETRALAMAIAVGDKGRKEVQAAREQIQTPRRRKEKEFARKYDLAAGPGVTGALREWDAAGKVTMELVITNPQDRASFVEEMRKRFGAQTSLDTDTSDGAQNNS